MTQPAFEDVPGALLAARQDRGRRYAALVEIAKRTNRAELIGDVIGDFVRNGFSRAEILAARRELLHTYRLDDRNPDDALAALRDIATPTIADSRPTDPGIEDYRHADVDDAGDSTAWMTVNDEGPET